MKVKKGDWFISELKGARLFPGKDVVAIEYTDSYSELVKYKKKLAAEGKLPINFYCKLENDDGERGITLAIKIGNVYHFYGVYIETASKYLKSVNRKCQKRVKENLNNLCSILDI